MSDSDRGKRSDEDGRVGTKAVLIEDGKVRGLYASLVQIACSRTVMVSSFRDGGGGGGGERLTFGRHGRKSGSAGRVLLA
jgi:hypothetical protein